MRVLISIVISILAGIITIIIGNFLALAFSLIFGFVFLSLAERILKGSTQKKFRHCGCYSWIGLTIGIIYSFLIYYFQLNGLVLLIIFQIYFIIFMKHKNEFIFNEICSGDVKQFNRLSRIVEIRPSYPNIFEPHFIIIGFRFPRQFSRVTKVKYSTPILHF